MSGDDDERHDDEVEAALEERIARAHKRLVKALEKRTKGWSEARHAAFRLDAYGVIEFLQQGPSDESARQFINTVVREGRAKALDLLKAGSPKAGEVSRQAESWAAMNKHRTKDADRLMIEAVRLLLLRHGIKPTCHSGGSTGGAGGVLVDAVLSVYDAPPRAGREWVVDAYRASRQK